MYMDKIKLSLKAEVALWALVNLNTTEQAPPSADIVGNSDDDTEEAAPTSFNDIIGIKEIEERIQRSQRVLLDLSRQKYPPDREASTAAMRKTLLNHAGIRDQAIIDRLMEQLGAPCVAELAEAIIDTRAACAAPVDLALEGKLASAMKAVPTASCWIETDEYRPNDFVDLIEHISHYHLMRFLVAANGLTLKRIFAPTGIAVLDTSRSGRATKAKMAAAVLAYNADWIVPLIGLMKIAVGGSIAEAVEQEIRKVPGLLTHAELAAAQLDKMFGDETEAVVREISEFARFYAPLIQREFASIADTLHANKTLYAFQNTEPLPRLFLTVVIAHAWIKQGSNEKSLLRKALEKVRAEESVQVPGLGKKAPSDALRLFFIVRNFRCCDETTLHAAGRKERLDAITRRYAEKVKRDGHEEFACGQFGTAAYKVYRAAVASGDEPTLREVHGWMPTLLRL